jgi:hypothetical protein
MKKLNQYISEAQQWFESPAAGDYFAIELEDDTLLETYVMGVDSDGGILLDSTDKMYSLLESWDMLENDIDDNASQLSEMAPLAAMLGRTLASAAGTMIGNKLSNNQQVGEYRNQADQDPGEYDQEGSMAKDDLNTIVSAARRLMGLLGDNDNMPEWTQSKIDRAADYVDTAADYIASKKTRGMSEGPVTKKPQPYNDPNWTKNLPKEKLDALAGKKSQGVGEGVNDLKNIDPGELAGSTLGGIAGYMAGDALGGPMVGFGAAGVGSAIGGALAKEGQLDGTAKQDSPAARAILHRILMRHPGMLATHGPEKVMSAVDEVADYIGDVEEIGSSDVSGWVRHVEQMLGNMQEQGMAEGEYDSRKPFGVRYKVFAGREGRVTTKEYWTTSSEKLEKAVAKIEALGNFYEIDGYSYPKEKQGVAEGPNDGKEDNFTIDDIKNLEQIRDLETLKAQAKELIKGKPARRMKPEKISWFYNHIDTLKNPLAVIKMMYDLMLAGEGNKVIGSRNSMSSNSYRSKFGEQDVSEHNMDEAEYQGRKVPLGKPMQGDVAKSKVYVRDPKTGNVKKVNFGDPNMKIRKSNPGARKSFRARHNCDNPGPRTKARYWSCRAW